MEIKKNKKEIMLIVLGLLIMAAPWVMLDFLAIVSNVVLGAAVIIVGAWPLIRKSQ